MKKISVVAVFVSLILLVSCSGINGGKLQEGSVSFTLPDSALEKVVRTVSAFENLNTTSFSRMNMAREVDEDVSEQIIDSDKLKIGYYFTLSNGKYSFSDKIWFSEDELNYFEQVYILKRDVNTVLEEHPEWVSYKDKKNTVSFELIPVSNYTLTAALQIAGTSYFYGIQKNISILADQEIEVEVKIKENDVQYSPLAILSGEYSDATRAGNYFTINQAFQYIKTEASLNLSENEEDAEANEEAKNKLAEELLTYSENTFLYAGISSYPATVSLKVDSDDIISAEAYSKTDDGFKSIECSSKDGVVSFKINQSDKLIGLILTATDSETGAYASTFVSVSNYAGKNMSGYVFYKCEGEEKSGLWLESKIPEGKITENDAEYMDNSEYFIHFCIDYSNNLWYIVDGENPGIYCNGKDAGWNILGLTGYRPMKITYDEVKDKIVVLCSDLDGKFYYYVCCGITSDDSGKKINKDLVNGPIQLEGFTDSPQAFASYNEHIYLVTSNYLYHFIEGVQKSSTSNCNYSGAFTKTTDIAYKDGIIYTINRYETDKNIFSRGSVIEWKLTETGDFITYRENELPNFYGTPKSSTPKTFSGLLKLILQIHTPDKDSTTELFGPEYFVSNRYGCLVFVDEGFYVSAEKGKAEVNNVNRIVTFDIETKQFSMTNVDCPFNVEYTSDILNLK